MAGGEYDFTPQDLEPDVGHRFVVPTAHEFKGEQNYPEDSLYAQAPVVVLPDQEVVA